MRTLLSTCFAILGAISINSASSADPPALSLERTIPLGDIKGRIDHLAVDLKGKRLFVAELGNDTVGVIDLRSYRVRQRVTDLAEPQGLGYMATTQTLYVANGGDGSVRTFTGDDLKPSLALKLAGDADNLRMDGKTSTLFVGYGSGAIAVIDAKSLRKISEVPLDGHPESFQIAATSNDIYINVPDAGQMVIADRQSGRVIRKVAARGLRANFPMTLDEEAKRLLVVFRDPPVLRTLTLDGVLLSDVDVCRDADDVFVDSKRRRTYVICGEGVVDVLNGNGLHVQRISTSAGARTGLFVPELDRLFVAIPARAGTKAEVRVFEPPNVAPIGRGRPPLRHADIAYSLTHN
jgi:DNA-binding beta-propeller fold protein YncE